MSSTPTTPTTPTTTPSTSISNFGKHRSLLSNPPIISTSQLLIAQSNKSSKVDFLEKSIDLNKYTTETSKIKIKGKITRKVKEAKREVKERLEIAR